MRSYALVLLLALIPLSARAQPVETATLLADLEAGMKSSKGEVVERTASRLQSLAKTLPKPEVLLPLIERGLYSGRGSAEHGVIGSSQTAYARVAERVTDPRPLVESLDRVAKTMKPGGLAREWVLTGVYDLARRFPKESLTTIERLLVDGDSDVREHARSCLYEATRRLPPREAMAFLDRQLLRTDLKPGLQSELRTVGWQVLQRAGRVPAEQRGEYLRLLDHLVKNAKSPQIQELARETRVELQTKVLERAASPDRFAAHRRADGSLNWGSLFKSPFKGKPAPGAGGGEGFNVPRRGAKGEVVKGFLPDVVSNEVFKTVRSAAVAEIEARLQSAPPAAKKALQAQLKALNASSIHYVETNDIVARRKGTKVEVSYGLLHEVYARSMQLMEAKKVTAGERGMYQARVLGLVFAHELAHVSGLKAERAADAKGVRTIWSSMLKPQNKAQADVLLENTIRLFEQPTGRNAFSNMLYRLRSWLRYGSMGSRLESMRRAAAGEPDPYQRLRRADGTVRWGQVAKERAAREAAGLAKFGLALFLKELAVVARTGDRGRIEEFFDYLLTTDFYKHYGLFVAGARLSEVAYNRYLSRYVKPKLVNGILKTNLALAAGMALPMIVEGNFEGRAFAISFASLGLSSALVAGGVRSIRWVTSLRKAKQAGLLARFGAGAGRLARVGGWFYTVGELAVVLYLADEIDGAITGYLDAKAARETLGKAGLDLASALEGELDEEALAKALDDNHAAWIGYRDWLYTPVLKEEARLMGSATSLAREAKLAADKRQALVSKAGAHPALRRRLEARHGSMEGYAEARAKEDEAALAERIEGMLAGYEKRREELFKAVYEGERREGTLLDDLELGEVFQAGSGGTSVFSRWNRDRARANLADTIGDRASTNRLQAYEDELALLRGLRQRHSRGTKAAALDAAIARAERLWRADQRLAAGDPVIEPKAGAASAIERSIRGQ